MSDKEKIYLIQCLLYDVRLNWTRHVKRRVKLAKRLCLEIGSDDFLTLVDECDIFLSDYKHRDGRFFRYPFPEGYENMEVLHRLSNTLHDKSAEFKGYIKKYITCPDWMFDDMKGE